MHALKPMILVASRTTRASRRSEVAARIGIAPRKFMHVGPICLPLRKGKDLAYKRKVNMVKVTTIMEIHEYNNVFLISFKTAITVL